MFHKMGVKGHLEASDTDLIDFGILRHGLSFWPRFALMKGKIMNPWNVSEECPWDHWPGFGY
jgi:hypothetical protein